jgi:seryl-tRNA synthetase
VESLKAERNSVSKAISQTKDPTERQQKIEAMRQVGDDITRLDEEVRKVEERLNYLVSSIPNLPDPTTPYGKDDGENIVLRVEGELPKFDFKPLPHWVWVPTGHHRF